MESIAERLKIIRSKLGVDQVQFGSAIGIASRSTISNWERGLAFPPADILANMRRQFGININWLVSGEGSMRVETRAESPGESIGVEECLSLEDYQMVPQIESKVTGGPDGELLYEEIEDYYPFKRWWIERLVGRSDERKAALLLVRVRGDSMSPTINQGEVVLVDTHESERIRVLPGRIYLVILPEGSVALKRLVLSEHDGTVNLTCLSDNTADYRPFEFAIDPGRSLKNCILGRVRWAGKEFE